MLAGIEILIARMKDYPEEFLRHARWSEMLEAYEEWFTEEERQALKTARREIMRERFNEMVLKRLAGETPDPDADIKAAKRSPVMRQVGSSYGWTDSTKLFK